MFIFGFHLLNSLIISTKKGTDIISPVIKAPRYSLILENQSLRIFPHAGSQTRFNSQVIECSACGNERRGRNTEKFTALDVCNCVHFVFLVCLLQYLNYDPVLLSGSSGLLFYNHASDNKNNGVVTKSPMIDKTTKPPLFTAKPMNKPNNDTPRTSNTMKAKTDLIVDIWFPYLLRFVVSHWFPFCTLSGFDCKPLNCNKL